MAKRSATELFEYYYMVLVYSLPIKDVDFMDELLKYNLLPGGVKSKLESLTVNYERSTYFLDNVIKPGLAVGSFVSLLTVMKCSKHDNVKDLATKIEKELTVDVKSSSKPLLKDLYNIVIPKVANDWYDLGVQLLDESQLPRLDEISTTFSNDRRRGCVEMLKYWLKITPEATWDNLIHALRAPGLQLMAVADDVEKGVEGLTKDQTESVDKGKHSETETQRSDSLKILQSQTALDHPDAYIEKFEDEDVVGAFAYLFDKLRILFGEVNFVQLKNACIQRGTLLPSEFKQQIKAAVELDDLLDALDNPMYCNWLNIRLLKRIVKTINIPEAKNLLQSYESCVYSRKVSEVMPYFDPRCFNPSHVSLVNAKIVRSFTNLTVADIIKYCEKLESSMGVYAGSVTATEYQPGCLQITCVIPIHCASHAHEMAKANFLKLRQFHIQYIEIESFPKVFALKFSIDNSVDKLTPASEDSDQVISHYYTCLENYMDADSVSHMMHCEHLITDDDYEAITAAPNDNKMNTLLLQYVRSMNVNQLSRFCDILKSIETHKIIGDCSSISVFQRLSTNVKVSASTQLMASSIEHMKMSDVNMIFCDLIDHLYLQLSVMEELPLYLREYDDIDPLFTEHINPLFTEQRLKKIKSLYLFKIYLLSFITWLDHSILEELVVESGSEDAQQLLDLFDSKIDSYCSQPITSFPIPSPSQLMIPLDDSEYTLLAMKFYLPSQGDVTQGVIILQDVRDIKLMMRDKWEMSHHEFNSIQLVAVHAKFELLYWIIPKRLGAVIKNNLLNNWKSGIIMMGVLPENFHSLDNNNEMLEGPLSSLKLLWQDNTEVISNNSLQNKLENIDTQNLVQPQYLQLHDNQEPKQIAEKVTETLHKHRQKGKKMATLTDWLIKTGLGQFETRLRQIGIKDVTSFTELDTDDLNEMEIIDVKCRLALMSAAQYVNEKSKGLTHKQLPLFMEQDSMESRSFSEHTDKVSIAIVGSGGSGKTNFVIQFISGKSIVDHEATLIDTYSKEINLDNTKCLVTLIDCGEEYGENLDVASTDGFIICHKANDMASLNLALKLVDEIIAIKDTTTLLPDTIWPIFLVRTHHERVEGDSLLLLMLPRKYANLNLCQYDLALGEVSYTDCCVRQMVQSIRSHRKSYSRPLEVSPSERKLALTGYWILQSVIGSHQSWNSSDFPIMELGKWNNVRWHDSSHQSNSIDDANISDYSTESILLSSTSFVVSPALSQITFNSEQGISISFLFAFDKDNHLLLRYEDDELKDDFKLYFNWLNQLPYPDLLPVSLSSYINEIEVPENDAILLVSSDRKKFQVYSAILNARCLSVDTKQLTSKDLPYSSNVIKSFVVYLYTNAPPLSLVDQKSGYSPVLTDSELMDLAQLAKQFGLSQLVQYCSLPRDTLLQSGIKQPTSDVSEMCLHFGLEMDKVCFNITDAHYRLKENFSEKNQVMSIHGALFFFCVGTRCAYQKILLMLYNYHNVLKKKLFKSQKKAFLSITLEWFKDVVDRYYNYLMDSIREIRALWNKPEYQVSSLERITNDIKYIKRRNANAFTKYANYINSYLDMFLEATLKSKPKSVIHMGRNISKVFKVRRTIKALQQFKKQLPFLAAEVIKELEFIASNDEHPDTYKQCKEFIGALIDFVSSKENMLHKFKEMVEKMSLKEWKAFINKCGGKLNYIINIVKSMKFPYTNRLWMSRYGSPRKLGMVLGVDMAWKVGILSQQPRLEFPFADKDYEDAMEKFSTSDNDYYLEFHKYQNSVSEIFEEIISKKSKDEAAPPTESIIPIAGLGMELQCLLKQDCSVPCDIHFQLDDGSLLGAHSVVVCARCSWFVNALESGMKESVNRRIPLPGVSLKAAHAFIFVLYTGSLPEDAVNQPMNHVGMLAEMMCLSHRLELYDMFSVCEIKLSSCINEENAIDLLTYADGLQAQLLYVKCVQFITVHTALHNCEELKRLSPKTRSFIEGEFIRATGNGRQPPQQLASLLKPYYFKQMARCETYTPNIAQVVKGSKPGTKKDKIQKSDDNDTQALSLQDIIKDLRHRAKAAQDAQH